MPEEKPAPRAASQGARVRALSRRLEARVTKTGTERKSAAIRKRSIPNIENRTVTAPDSPGSTENVEVHDPSVSGSPNPTAGSWTNVPSQPSVFSIHAGDSDGEETSTPFDDEVKTMTEEQLRERLIESHRELTRELKRSNQKDEHIDVIEAQLREAADANDAIGVDLLNARGALLNEETQCAELASEMHTMESSAGERAYGNDDDDPVNGLLSELQEMASQRDEDKGQLQAMQAQRVLYIAEATKESEGLCYDFEVARAALESEEMAAAKMRIEYNKNISEMRAEYHAEVTLLDRKHARENTDLREETGRLRSELGSAYGATSKTHSSAGPAAAMPAAKTSVQSTFSDPDPQSSDILRMLNHLSKRLEFLENPKSVERETIDQEHTSTKNTKKAANPDFQGSDVKIKSEPVIGSVQKVSAQDTMVKSFSLLYRNVTIRYRGSNSAP